MPEPVRAGQRYMPGLDGLRAVAVLAVIAFHEQLGWAPGGLLGVGVFFTLSGYLITDLLLGQWAARGRVALADFWARRARRLLPALFVMVAVITAWVTLFDRARLPTLRGADAAAATYSSNWYLIIQGQSYFARFAPPQPLDHLWSLAVEEQFYLVWPWLLLAGLLLVRKIRRGRPGGVAWLALPTMALAAGSAWAMLALYHPGLDPTRVYEGTDTRAAGLLIGAALAMTWPSRRPAPGRAARAVLDVGGFAGLAVIALMIWRTGQYSPFLYRGGLVLLSFASAAVIAAVAVPSALTGRVLGCPPLRWLGVRSYGIYLWHYPVIVLTTPANSTENLVRAAWQAAVTIVVAALSWRYIEEPIRRGALARLWKQVRATTARPAGAHAAVRTGRAGALAAAPTALAAVAAAAVLVTASAGLSGAFSAPAATNAASLAGSSLPAPSGHGSSPAAGAQPAPARAGNKLPSSGSATALRTSCNAVAHLGDSTSEGMVSAAYLANPNQRLVAQYHDVGVKKVVTNIVGANSIVETLPGDTNGYNAAKGIVKQGFKGCWVIALGTNDAADVAIGSSVDPAQRIGEIMSVAHGSPVLWVNVVSTLNSGPYAESSMQAWNTALSRACAKYPNMRVFNWASLVQPSWFISDGIHYTSAGYAQRSEQIADALAKAFPARGHSSGCMVS
jgi:peptidoglycan/LPS O-acetylase OafA/YrhL/lysophospholipase L1-like esterase